MHSNLLNEFENKISAKVKSIASADDPAHDILHFYRVVNMAKKLCTVEGGRIEVVMPAAWLHDLVIVPKNSPLRAKASSLSAEAAVDFLDSIGYPKNYHADISHAIEAHSFSAGITPRTLEAQIVQDADRLDGVGAIGIARCFATAGLLKREFYSIDDAFCDKRIPNDQQYTLDHFYIKLFKTVEMLQTESARVEGAKRLQVMRDFVQALATEIT